MAPFSTLAGMLGQSFSDPRLAQLFGQGGFYVCARSARVPRLLGMFFSVIEHEAAEHGFIGRMAGEQGVSLLVVPETGRL
mgnify:CR=1 FL=1